MIQMAANTFFAVRILHLEPRMVSLVFRNQTRDFFVTFQAFERGRASTELMAACALARATQRLMGLGQRAGRDLRLSGRSRKHERRKQNREADEGGKAEIMGGVASDLLTRGQRDPPWCHFPTESVPP